MKRTLVTLTVLALAACASTPTHYEPANGSDRGFSETRIEQDRYRVRFAAGSDTTFQQAEDFALRRAAELTLREGMDWFLVVSRHRDGNDRNPVGVGGSVGHTWGSGGFSGSGVGIGIRIDGNAGDKEVGLEIVLRTGERPDQADAYDARAILEYEAGD
ncbi:CC0125/CC1285 family lipoprotein [Maricaulis parjimensis]|uniref:CC0125/CC1285 family lipoprotein n=1 Tax=Maricaulis parjimensis TaxID=144023 RepID=UPI00193A9F3C|nr:hypothetical protein [Maricaulis parjimensis]